jgi:RNA polymerase sigma-32 factor
VKRPGLPEKVKKPGLPRARSPFEQYISEINRVPLLSRAEELELSREFQKHRDPEAAKRLVEANLRFVVKMAYSYRNYNVKMTDLIQEGNIGLMKAVEKFNPERGYRLISYAVWWIKAYMQNYIIRSWSMVRVGTSQMQKQLFFRHGPEEDPEQEAVAETLQEDETETAVLVPVQARREKATTELTSASRDFSLDASIEKGSQLTFAEVLADQSPGHDDQLAREEILELVSERLGGFMEGLSDKEAYIMNHRLLSDQAETLQEIGERFGVSRERIRQIENSLKERLRESLGHIEGITDIVS